MRIARINIKQNGIFLNAICGDRFYTVNMTGMSRLEANKKLISKIVKNQQTK